jgi:hypothetical protein
MSSKKNKKATPPSSPSSSVTTTETAPAPSTETPPDELEELEQLDQVEGPPATAQLLEMLFHLWLSEMLKPCFYFMTRTFAHHRLGEKYDTRKVFDQLMLLNRGNHAELMAEIESFRETLFKDLETILAASGEPR